MTDPPSQDSNTRLANVFEMIVSRLDTIESNQAALKAQLDTIESKLDRQDLADRHADSSKELGQPFSGVRLCGRCVQLVVNCGFRADGSLTYGFKDDLVIVVNMCDLTEHFGSPVWEWEGAWKWDDDILKEWGQVKCDEVRARMQAWYRDDCDRPDYASPQDVGAGPSHFNTAYEMIYEAALKGRHPGLLAIGQSGVAVSHCSIGSAVGIVDAIATDLECNDLLDDDFQIYCVPKLLGPLAVAILVEGYATLCPGKKAAWMALNERTKKNLLAEQDEPGVFFTRARLVHCG